MLQIVGRWISKKNIIDQLYYITIRLYFYLLSQPRFKNISRNKMGNICAGKHQKQQTTETVDNSNRNFELYSYILKGYANIELIIGTYHCHKSQTLLALVQKQYLDYCTEMRDYCDNIQQAISLIMNQQEKSLTTLPTNRECPYKKLQICMLPAYSSNQAESQKYLAKFQSICKQILNASLDITVQLTHTSQNTNGLPNQTLMSIFMKVLSEKISQIKQQNDKTTVATSASTKQKKVKLAIIGNDSKLINLARFQILKQDDYEIRKSHHNHNHRNHDRSFQY